MCPRGRTHSHVFSRSARPPQKESRVAVLILVRARLLKVGRERLSQSRKSSKAALVPPDHRGDVVAIYRSNCLVSRERAGRDPSPGSVHQWGRNESAGDHCDTLVVGGHELVRMGGGGQVRGSTKLTE